MSKLIKKIGLMILLIMLLITSFSIKTVYAKTEEEELKELLDECKTDLGDLNEFKQVIDNVYNDLNSATTVDETLKTKLKADIKELSNVTGIDPLILASFDIEFNSQIDGLTDENLSEMQKEFAVMKEWVDEQPEINNSNNNNSNGNNNNIDNDGNNNFTNQDEDKNQNVIDNSNKDNEDDLSQLKNNNKENEIANNLQETNTELNDGLPKTGKNTVIMISAIIIVLCVAIVSIIRYKKLKGI